MIFRNMLRNIRKNIIQIVLMVISLALSTAFVYLTLNIQNDLLIVSNELFSGDFGGYDIVVSSDDGIPRDEQDLKDLTTISIQYIDECQYKWLGKEIFATIVATDWEAATSRNIVKIDSGELPTSFYTIGLKKETAKLYNIKLGDTLTAILDGKKENFRVTCLFSSLGVFGNERDHSVVIATGFEPSYPNSAVFIDTQNVEEAEAIVQELTKAHPEWSAELISKSVGDARHIKDIQRILIFMTILSAIIGYYIIYSVSSMILRARLPEIGTFRSIGVSRRKMNGLLVLENAIYGILGGIVGILLGELLRMLLRVLYYHTESSAKTNPLFILLTLLFSICLQVGISFFAILKNLNKSIKETIFETHSVYTEPSKLFFPIGLFLLLTGIFLHYFNTSFLFWMNILSLAITLIGFVSILPFLMKVCASCLSKICLKKGKGPLFLSLKRMYASHVNISSTIMICAITSLVVILSVCTSSVNSFYTQYEKNYPYDILIKKVNRECSTYDFLRDIPGVESVSYEKWDYDNTLLDDEKTRICFVERYGYPNGIEVDNALVDNLEDGHTIIDELYARRHHIKKDDVVRLSLYDVTFYLTIDGFCESGIFNSSKNTMFMTKHDFELYIEDCPAQIGIILKDDVNSSSIKNALANAIYEHTGENVSIYMVDEYLSVDYDRIHGALKVFNVIPLFAVILAILGLLNNQIMTYHQKKREYAILYSIAMSKSQLTRSIFFEMIFVFLFGSACGVLMSACLLPMIRDILFTLISYVELSYNFATFLRVFCISLALLCMTSIIPQRIAKKIHIVEVIKYE